MRKLEYGKNERNERKENEFRKTSGLKGLKLAAVLTSALSLGAAGCGKDMVASDTENLLCKQETIKLEQKSNEATVALNETVVFPNGYKMTLVGVERATQIALFVIKNKNGDGVYNLDMAEGVDYVIEFPAEAGSLPEKVKVASCSVRVPDNSNEVSVTLRANVPLQVAEEQCVPNLAPTDCNSTEPVVRGIITKGQSVKVGNFVLYFEGTEEDQQGKIAGIFRYEDSCGKTLSRNRVSEGHTVTVFMWGAGYELDVFSLYASSESEWADIKVEMSCVDNCPLTYGIINLGEVLPVNNNLKIRLDDVQQESGLDKALLSILDASDAVQARLSLAEGETEIVDQYIIRIDKVAAGYTLNAKWAAISVSSIDCK